MRTPQVTPSWSTGIYIGNGVVATPKKVKDKACPECQGEGIIERVNWNGPYEEPCPYCYGSMGRVNINV